VSWRRCLIILSVVASGAAIPVSAVAETRVGSVADPADRPGEADVAAVTIRYDDAGRIDLRVRFHAALAEGESATADWSVTLASPEGGCSDTRQGLAGLLDLDSGDTALTYSETTGEGVPTDVEIPARRTLSGDRRELHVAAESPALARRSFACSQLALSNGDEVPLLRLVAEVTTGSPGAADPVVPSRERGAGARVARGGLALDRRGRLIIATVRALICAPPRSSVVAIIGLARRRVGRPLVTPERRRAFRRHQRLRCQEHRFTWRFRTASRARYEVRVRLWLGAVDAARLRVDGADPE